LANLGRLKLTVNEEKTGVCKVPESYRVTPRLYPIAEVKARNWAVRMTLKNRHHQPALAGPFRADTVAKVVLQKVSKFPRAAGSVFV
jgi:hypothetical protein